MKSKKQYNQSSVGETSAISTPKPGLTKSSADRKVEVLEEQLAQQHKEIAKLRRDISRIKSNVSDIISVLKDRG